MFNLGGTSDSNSSVNLNVDANSNNQFNISFGDDSGIEGGSSEDFKVFDNTATSSQDEEDSLSGSVGVGVGGGSGSGGTVTANKEYDPTPNSFYKDSFTSYQQPKTSAFSTFMSKKSDNNTNEILMWLGMGILAVIAFFSYNNTKPTKKA